MKKPKDNKTIQKIDGSSSPSEVFFHIRKLSQIEYELVKTTTVGESIVDQTIVHKDIPNIVYGKFLQCLRKQDFV